MSYACLLSTLCQDYCASINAAARLVPDQPLHVLMIETKAGFADLSVSTFLGT